MESLCFYAFITLLVQSVFQIKLTVVVMVFGEITKQNYKLNYQNKTLKTQ